MNRVRLALFLCPSILSLVVLASSCSDKQDDAPAKAGSKYHQGKDSGTPEGAAPEIDAAALLGLSPDAAGTAFDMREIKTVAQAFSALNTAYDIAEQEGELGKANTNTPPLQAYSHDLIEDVKASKARLKRVAQAKDITPRNSSLNNRMKFESQAALRNLTGIFRNMFNSAWMARRVEAERSTLGMIEQQIAPLMNDGDDEDLKREYSLLHDDAEKRLARAETVKTGLSDGVGGLDDGMFEDIEGPQAPEPPREPKPEEPPKDAGH